MGRESYGLVGDNDPAWTECRCPNDPTKRDYLLRTCNAVRPYPVFDMHHVFLPRIYEEMLPGRTDARYTRFPNYGYGGKRVRLLFQTPPPRNQPVCDYLGIFRSDDPENRLAKFYEVMPEDLSPRWLARFIGNHLKRNFGLEYVWGNLAVPFVDVTIGAAFMRGEAIHCVRTFLEIIGIEFHDVPMNRPFPDPGQLPTIGDLDLEFGKLLFADWWGINRQVIDRAMMWSVPRNCHFCNRKAKRCQEHQLVMNYVPECPYWHDVHRTYSEQLLEQSRRAVGVHWGAGSSFVTPDDAVGRVRENAPLYIKFAVIPRCPPGRYILGDHPAMEPGVMDLQLTELKTFVPQLLSDEEMTKLAAEGVQVLWTAHHETGEDMRVVQREQLALRNWQASREASSLASEEPSGWVNAPDVDMLDDL